MKKTSKFEKAQLVTLVGLVIAIISVVGGTSVIGAVLTRNGSFETQGSSSEYAYYWEYNNPDTHGGVWDLAARTNWRAHSGTFEAVIRGSWATTNGQQGGGWWQESAATPNVGYRFSTWAWADNNWTSREQGLKIEFYDSSGSLVSAVTNTFDDVGETWVQKSLSATAPANAAWVRGVMYADGVSAGGALQFDDASMTDLPEPNSVALISVAGLIFYWRRKLSFRGT